MKQAESNLFGPVQIEYAFIYFHRQNVTDVFTSNLLVSVDSIDKQVIPTEGADLVKRHGVHIFCQG